MKKNAQAVIVGITLIAVTTLGSPVVHAAERATKVPGCAAPSSKAHLPMTLKQPAATERSNARTLTLKTNCGSIVISLLTDAAPITVKAISTLANAGFYNKSICHRLTTEGLYVLQCGDPTLTGGGSPKSWTGYADENLPKDVPNNYPAGTVAMANSGPKTNGSQFFLVYKDTKLPPNYTIWGKITQGLDLLKKIGEVGAYKMNGQQAYYAPDGYPVQTVEILSARAR